MINRTLFLIFFFMAAVVLYYKNLALQKKYEVLKAKVEKKDQNEYSEQEYIKTIKTLQRRLEQCDTNKSKSIILNLEPAERLEQKNYEPYTKSKEFSNIKVYNENINATKKEKFKVSPDVIYNKEKEDLGLRLEVKKQF